MLCNVLRGLGAIFVLFVILLGSLCIPGCLEWSDESMPEPIPAPGDQRGAGLQLDYDLELKEDWFWLHGDLLLPGSSPLSYILLNASLRQGQNPILNAKYLLMQIEPNREYGFEVCKSSRLAAGEYDCILKAESPQGVLAEVSRKVRLEQSRSNPGVWSEAEEASFWQMIEENEMDGDGRREERDKREEDGSGRAESEKRSGFGDRSDPENLSGAAVIPAEKSKVGRNAESTAKSAPLLGSATSKKYHLPDCRYAEKIKPENLVRFPSIEDARAEGYLPCKVCHP